MKMHILLTGATGYLGSHILKKLIKDNQYDITLLIRDKSNCERINSELNLVNLVYVKNISKRIFSENKFNTIIHCATNYGKNTEIRDVYEANFFLPFKILNLAKDSGVEKFVNTSTSLNKDINFYSLSKKHFEEVAIAMSKTMSLSFINVILELFYGADAPDSIFPSYIINSLKKNIIKIDITEGKQKRDFIYIDDVVEAYLKIIQKKFDNGFLNLEIGSGAAVSIRSFVKIVMKLTNSKTIINFGSIPYRENEQMYSKANLKEMLKIGWHPKINLVNGIKKYL